MMKDLDGGEGILQKNNILLIAVLLVAAVFRLWSLTTVPPSPSLDEVSIGYNAYSLLHTGRDEYGNFLPILLRAYDDWRPALYVYLVVPFIAFFGLNTLTVRLPSVLLSLGTIYLSYKITLIIFRKNAIPGKAHIDSQGAALFVALLMAISPWNIYLSRLGHEVNSGLFFTVSAVYLFLSGVLGRRKKILLLSGLVFGLSFYTYQSEKVVIPVVLLALVVCFRRELWKMKAGSIFAVAVFLIVVIPAIFTTLSPEGMTRFRGTSVFSNTSSLQEESAKDVLSAKQSGNLIAEMYFNRRLVPIRLFAAQYFSHFNPFWLFAGGERENHKVPYMGLLYLFEAPLLVVGLLAFLFSPIDMRFKFFLFIWFLSSPLPAALTTEAPHALRSFTFFPTMQLVEAYGFFFILSFLKNRLFQSVFVLGTATLAVMNITGFIRGYYFIFPKNQADSFQSALLSSMRDLSTIKNNYTTIVVSNQKNLYQSYMFYLFASKYDPLKYQSNGGTRSGGYAEVHMIDNIEFRPINWSKEKKETSTLFLGNPEDFDSSAKVLKHFLYPNGKEGVVAVEG